MPYLRNGINKFQQDDRIFKEKVKIFIVFVKIMNCEKNMAGMGSESSSHESHILFTILKFKVII